MKLAAFGVRHQEAEMKPCRQRQVGRDGGD